MAAESMGLFGWRSPLGATEDRNDAWTTYTPTWTVRWRLPFGATEDRNHIVAGPIMDKLARLAVALQGDRGSQRRTRAALAGRELVWRSPFGVTDSAQVSAAGHSPSCAADLS
ncbi:MULTISPECIES: hypothetical protein [unclassified Streptomyces]|uniref:hypothetical protein n=1 Tax=unclassified Streptomyces TaxID=2593676 RepID=UPI00070BAA63|nr:hypothetical protein [Streptomyces sp. Root1310]KQX77040.1 hypothetical protein ASD48_38295 [Streptomyces sp. Root1310]